MLLIFGAIGFAGARARRNSIDSLLVSASLVGDDLIRKTNSDRLISMGPAFTGTLKDFLASHARIESVRQETSPDKRQVLASVWLINEEDKRLNVQLRWERLPAKFTLVGYAYPAALPAAASR